MERGFGVPLAELSISRERLPADAQGRDRYLVVATPTAVLAEYEHALHSLGWRAGLIVPRHIGEGQWLTQNGAAGDALLLSSSESAFTAVVFRGKQRLDTLHEIPRVERLHENAVAPRGARLHFVDWLERAAEKEDGNVTQRRRRLHVSRDAVTIHVRSADLGEDDVGRIQVDQLHGFAAVRHADDANVFLFERERDDARQSRVVETTWRTAGGCHVCRRALRTIQGRKSRITAA